MKQCAPVAVAVAAAIFLPVSAGRLSGQELNAEAKSKDISEARAKRNALNFQNNAQVLTFLDRYGKRTGQIGDRAIYDVVVLSPDGKRVATIKEDLDNENADLWVSDLAGGGAVTRITTSPRTERVSSAVWSPDSTRLAFVTIRKGQEAIYIRPADGKGSEELLYRNPGAFLNLTDWSRDGRFLSFSISDISGGTLYVLPVGGGQDQKPVEIFHSDLRIFESRFSPDGRYLSYLMLDKTDRAEVFVRPADPAAKEGPWQISDGTFSPGFWTRGGKELYYQARNQAVMTADVRTSPSFSFSKPKVLFRQPVPVPDSLQGVSADGERLIVLPPARGQELQQITIFDRKGKVLRKIGDPALYSAPAFSPDGRRLLIMKTDIQTGQQDIWVLDIANAQATRLTNDTRFKTQPLWSSDGTYVFYTALVDGDWPVYRKAADGTASEEVMFRYTPGAFVGLSDISPDGKFLVCDSGGVILLVPLTAGDPATRKEIEFVRDEFIDAMGRVSPDGRWIAFVSDEAKPERFEAYILPFDSAKPPPPSKKLRVSKDGVGFNFMSPPMMHWRSDGKEIFFRGQELDSNDLVMMTAAVDSSSPGVQVAPPKELFRLPGPINGSHGAISRDGQQFVLAINVPADKIESPAVSK